MQLQYITHPAACLLAGYLITCCLSSGWLLDNLLFVFWLAAFVVCLLAGYLITCLSSGWLLVCLLAGYLITCLPSAFFWLPWLCATKGWWTIVIVKVLGHGDDGPLWRSWVMGMMDHCESTRSCGWWTIVKALGHEVEVRLGCLGKDYHWSLTLVMETVHSSYWCCSGSVWGYIIVKPFVPPVVRSFTKTID